MRTIAEIAQENFGVSTRSEASKHLSRALRDYDPPRTTPTHLLIPYFAENCPEVPPLHEIQKARKESILNAKNGLNEVFRTQDMVFKIGAAQEIIEEAENLIFLAENSQVRVPKVYAVYPQSTNGYSQYILVTEFIKGVELKYEDWMSFTEEERTTLCARLGEQYRLLRSIPSEGYYGRIHHQAFDRKMGMFRTNGKQSSGPYETYEEFTLAVIRSAEVFAMIGRCHLQERRRLDEDQELLLSEYKLALETSTDRKPVFTHVDPGLKNIIFHRISGPHDPPDWEVTLIDWAGAGWFPAWVQGAAFAQRFGIWDKSGNVYVDLAKEFVARAYGNMECGAELVRICTQARRKITQRIY